MSKKIPKCFWPEQQIGNTTFLDMVYFAHRKMKLSYKSQKLPRSDLLAPPRIVVFRLEDEATTQFYYWLIQFFYLHPHIFLIFIHDSFHIDNISISRCTDVSPLHNTATTLFHCGHKAASLWPKRSSLVSSDHKKGIRGNVEETVHFMVGQKNLDLRRMLIGR